MTATWEWRRAFLEHAEIDPYGILVGLVVAERADVTTGQRSHPGMAELMARTRMRDERAVRARLHLLEAAGWLTVTHPGGSPKGSTRMAREWSLTVPTPPASDAPSQEADPPRETHPVSDAPPGSHAPSHPLRDTHPVGTRPPASHATTPCVPRARPPASDAPPSLPHPDLHPEGRADSDREAAAAELLTQPARALIEEAVGVMAKHAITAGDDAVDQAVADAIERRVRVRWPSELDTTLAALLVREATDARPQNLTPRTTSRNCPRCGNTTTDPLLRLDALGTQGCNGCYAAIYDPVGEATG